MAMRIELRRTVQLERWQVVADFATFDPRPEIQLLLRKVQEVGRFDTGVVEAVLPGLGNGGATGLKSHLMRLDLIDRDGVLTSAGAQVVATGRVPVAETGLYELLIATDDVFGTRAFGVSRVEASAATTAPLPFVAQIPSGKAFPSWVGDETWMLRRIASPRGVSPKGSQFPSRSLQLTLRVSAGDVPKSEWTLSGRFTASDGEHDVPARPEGLQALDPFELVKPWIAANPAQGRWDPLIRALRVEFDPDRLDARARNDFVTTIALQNVEVPGRGRFAECTIEGVLLAPIDEMAAQKWATARLLDAVRPEAMGHLSRQELHQHLSSVVVGTPLEEFAPSLPEHGEFVRSVSSDVALAWRLRAAVDLHPTGVPATWLARVPLKQPPKPEPLKGSAGLTILPDERRSLDEVVRALNLTGGRKCVIYDKHLGPASFPILKALVLALKESTPGLRIGIVSRLEANDEAQQFKQLVRQLLGADPLDIRSLGDGKALHGRYLVFGDVGAPTATFQATHSLVHARPERGTPLSAVGPQTPLIWNDIAFKAEAAPPPALRLAWERLS